MKQLLPILILLLGQFASGQNTNPRRILQEQSARIINNSPWDETEPAINGFSRVLKGNKFTFTNNLGTAISNPVFDGARNFSNHLAAVEKDDKWGFINERGLVVIPMNYEIVYDFVEDFTIVYQNKKWFKINKTGINLTELNIDICYGIKNGVILISKNGKKGHIQSDGRIMYDQITADSTATTFQRTNPIQNNNVTANCPDNLTFEFGNFTNWRCYTGTVDSIGNTNVVTVALSGPVANRHRIVTRAIPSAVDFFGLFPTNPPDGSNFAVKLGNTNIGAQAERISYTIRVPQNDSNFSIKYDYAVVFQDPGHTTWSQPRFTAKLFDSASNRYVDCASFEYISTSNLPGFARSTVDTSVIYKPWASAFISLRAYAGRTMYLEFTTADCVRRGHWGYAYLDVENTCGQSVGVQYNCNYPNITTLDGPPGFQYYHWWNQNYTSVLANGQHAVLNPGPAYNTTIWLEMVPFNSYGCRDTMPVILTGGFTPSFNSSETNTSCAPHSITFYNNNIPSLNATWNFGDGSTGTGDTVTHVYNTTGTFIVTMSVSLPSGCSGSISDTITIAQPTGSYSYTGGTFCKSQSVQFNVTSTNATSYDWDFGDGTLLNTTQATISHIYINPGAYLPKLIVHFNGGCQMNLPGTDSIKIENLNPDFIFNTQKVCNATTINFIDQSQSQFGITGYSWSFADGTTGSGSSISHTYTRPSTYLVKLIITGNTGCKDSITHPVNITINVPPAASIISPLSVCANDPITLVSNVRSRDSIATISWSTDNGFTANGDSATFVFPQSGTYTATLIATTVFGCADTATKQITIKELPVIALPGDQTLCNGARTSAVVFTSSVSGTSYTWDNNNPAVGLAATGSGNLPSFTATNNSSTTIYANVTVTALAQGCSLVAPAFTFIVHPTPESIQPANQALCNRGMTDPVIFSGFTSAVASNNYNWTNNLPSIGLPASGSGNIMSFSAINNSIVPVIATITLTPTANGCTGLPVDFTITVNPTPDVQPLSNLQVCNGVLTNTISFTGLTGADVYIWTNNEPSIGLTSTGTGDIRPFNAINNTNGPIIASISVYPILIGCVGQMQYLNITVNPTPTVSDPFDQNVCAGYSTTDVIWAGLVSGTSYNWTNNSPAIGLPANGTGDILSFNPVNNSYFTDTASITITPSINGCNGLPQSFDIIVKPLPDFIQPFNQFNCDGQTTPLIIFNGPVNSTTYTWTNNNPLIGLPASGNGNILPFTTVNNSNVSVTATINVTASAGGCLGNTKTFTINIDPSPNMAQPNSLVVCNGATIDPINFTGTVAGTTFNWINSNSEIGIPANGTGNISSFIATNNNNYPITAVITVVGLANSCNSVDKTFTITIYPSVGIDSVPNFSVCNGKTMNSINITGPVIGTIYTWTNNNPSIGLAANGQGDILPFVAVNNTNNIQIATISVYAASPDNCQTAINTFKIMVNPSPQMATGNDVSMCRGSQGSLSASGAVNYEWSPSMGLSCVNCANPVTTTVSSTTYQVIGTNALGCKSLDSILVSVIQPFDMLVSPNDSMCTGKSVHLRAMNADRYVWSPSTGLDNPNIAEPNATPTSNIRYQVIGYDAQHCFTDTGYVYITVGNTPGVNAGADINAATGTTAVLHGTSQNGPITSWSWSPPTNLSCNDCQTPTLTVGNNSTYVLTVQNSFGCKAMDTLNIIAFCKNAQVFIANAFSPDGDGINDMIIVRGTGISVKSFRIFNRWGNLVFEKQAFQPNDPKYGWDGKVKGVLATPDVFVYIAEIVCDNGTPYLYKGNITIIQ
ncbi:MAG: PKD domain-containing protein [Bacteroidota bacterium]